MKKRTLEKINKEIRYLQQIFKKDVEGDQQYDKDFDRGHDFGFVEGLNWVKNLEYKKEV